MVSVVVGMVITATLRRGEGTPPYGNVFYAHCIKITQSANHQTNFPFPISRKIKRTLTRPFLFA